MTLWIAACRKGLLSQDNLQKPASAKTYVMDVIGGIIIKHLTPRTILKETIMMTRIPTAALWSASHMQRTHSLLIFFTSDQLPLNVYSNAPF